MLVNPQKNPVIRYGYNEYMVHHYKDMTKMVEICELESYAKGAQDTNWKTSMGEEMHALVKMRLGPQLTPQKE